MALAKETLCPTITELAFVRKESTEDGKGLVFYFQSDEYIAEYNLQISISQLFAQLSENQLMNFKGNIKFTVSADLLGEPQYEGLRKVKPYAESKEIYVVAFGFSPQVIAGAGIKYAKTKLVKVYESWGEYLKELKENGKLNPANNNRTPAATPA